MTWDSGLYEDWPEPSATAGSTNGSQNGADVVARNEILDAQIVERERWPIALDALEDKIDWIDISTWDHEPLPERKWAIKDRVPLNQAGLFSGEGGTGKSIIELMKDVAHVAAKDWLGSLPEPGPAFYIGAEDDKDELHIRLAAIAKHYEVTFKDLADLRVLCLHQRVNRRTRG